MRIITADYRQLAVLLFRKQYIEQLIFSMLINFEINPFYVWHCQYYRIQLLLHSN